MMTPDQATRHLTVLDSGELSGDEEHDLLRDALTVLAGMVTEYAVIVSYDGRTWESICDSDGVTWMGAGEAQEHLEWCRRNCRHDGAVHQVAARVVSAPETWRPDA